MVTCGCWRAGSQLEAALRAEGHTGTFPEANRSRQRWYKERTFLFTFFLGNGDSAQVSSLGLPLCLRFLICKVEFIVSMSQDHGEDSIIQQMFLQ